MSACTMSSKIARLLEDRSGIPARGLQRRAESDGESVERGVVAVADGVDGDARRDRRRAWGATPRGAAAPGRARASSSAYRSTQSAIGRGGFARSPSTASAAAPELGGQPDRLPLRLPVDVVATARSCRPARRAPRAPARTRRRGRARRSAAAALAPRSGTCRSTRARARRWTARSKLQLGRGLVGERRVDVGVLRRAASR